MIIYPIYSDDCGEDCCDKPCGSLDMNDYCDDCKRCMKETGITL